MSALTYSTLVQDGIRRAGDQRMPNGDPLVSSPLTCTLIAGDRTAVLVDPPLTRDQTERVGDWITRSGKELSHVYITHGHGDHWFGAGELLRRFPTARSLGAARGDRDDAPSGHDRTRVEVGPGLSRADRDTVVAGDAVYDNVHLYLSEGADGGFDAWLRALDTVANLHPGVLVAGHQDRGRSDTPKTVPQTRAYLNDVTELLARRPSPMAFFEEMLIRHPGRLNPSPLWYGAQTLLA